MTKPNKAKAKEPSKSGANNSLNVKMAEKDSTALATAKALIAPGFRHGMATSQLFQSQLKGLDDAPGAGDYADALEERALTAAKGDLAFASRLLAAQAMTLDNIFAEMARRMALNMGEYLGATETYARIALKAQAGSRATIEALAKLHQPREQTVRHVHVNEGGQAVVADHFHQHAGGKENGKTSEQPHATGAAGASPALPGPNPLGDDVPIPGGEREPAMQDARRQGQRGT